MTLLVTRTPTGNEHGPAAPGRPRRRWGRYARRPIGLVAAAYLAGLIVATVGAPLWTRTDPEFQDLAQSLAGPSAAHWLGTDRLGRDVAVRLLYGGRVTLLAVVEAVVVFAVVGVTLGLLAGYLGGTVDRVVGWVSDLLLSLPGIVILLMVLAVFPGNTGATMVVLGLISAPMLLRVTRSVTLVVRQELYVRAARLAGLTGVRVMWRHIVPRLVGPIVVQVFLFAATAVLVQGALSFLGLSAPETDGPSWGNMIGEASQVASQDVWLAIPTGGVLMLTVLTLGLVGDAVRDVTADRRRAPATLAYEPSPSTVDLAATAPGALLSVRSLTIGFGPVSVVRDVSFDVAPGECLGIVGESGSGKTITARSLLGLLPAGGRVVAGSASFDGRDLFALSEREFGRIRGSRIGLVSQEPMSGLDPSFRVGAQVTEVVRRHHRLGRAQALARAVELLDLVRLPDPAAVARRYPHELSGGMAQRVAIALALAGEPDLLVADEPTTALDVTVQAEILALLRDLGARLGTAIILVTHDWGVLADLGDRAVVMYAGEVVEQATVDELYRSPRHPYTRLLLAANPHNAPVGGALPTIAGSVPAPADWGPGCRFQPRCPYAVSACGAHAIPLVATGQGRIARCIRTEEVAAL
jgi:peptide/nickel transport system permease protein